MTAATPRRRSPRRGVAALVAVLILAASPAASAASVTLPEDLPGDVTQLAADLARVAEADDLQTARAAHEQVEASAPHVVPHAPDLAGRDGELLATLLDELDAALARGNLSDARSLAQAGANTLEDDIAPAAEQWSTNRTAITPGPPRWSGDRVLVPLLLVNPPPGGLGAVDVEVTANATPDRATLATGQGETTIDPTNRTARLASFDAQALANLETNRRETTLLGEVAFGPDALAAGDELKLTVTVRELADPGGHRVLVLGLDETTSVPPEEHGSPLLESRWLAVGGLVLGAAALIALVRRLEV